VTTTTTTPPVIATIIEQGSPKMPSTNYSVYLRKETDGNICLKHHSLWDKRIRDNGK